MTPTEIIILRELLNAGTAYVAGTHLAKILGVSRVAVWMQLQKLTSQGFEFEAAHSRGYRIAKLPSQLHEALLHSLLHGRTTLPKIICLETVDSTNSEAERQLAAGCTVPLVILAREQTKGRGRRGRVWHSPAAGNLYSTFVFRPELEPAQLQDFTLWMGLNICELIANFCRLTPGLKWPNDVHVNGRKVGGILTEARVDADQVRDLVFGLGLNLNGRTEDLPENIRHSATSLAAASDTPVDPNRFAAALIGRVIGAYEQFLEGNYRDKFADLWKRYDVLRSQPVTVTQGTRIVSGTATGIDDEGSLIVRLESGSTERFRAGEVTLSREAASTA
ncbi:biotin--[acetyl-CoA-carboxylase] ligase [Oleiharenicola lentus]|uniref:biotin--[acetyl-CoA-carboxylase] ligase n=1 Tax=Oleiharenicola lentus TaxID=2508720 RepID=UPI003F6766B9